MCLAYDLQKHKHSKSDMEVEAIFPQRSCRFHLVVDD